MTTDLKTILDLTPHLASARRGDELQVLIALAGSQLALTLSRNAMPADRKKALQQHLGGGSVKFLGGTCTQQEDTLCFRLANAPSGIEKRLTAALIGQGGRRMPIRVLPVETTEAEGDAAGAESTGESATEVAPGTRPETGATDAALSGAARSAPPPAAPDGTPQPPPASGASSTGGATPDQQVRALVARLGSRLQALPAGGPLATKAAQVIAQARQRIADGDAAKGIAALEALLAALDRSAATAATPRPTSPETTSPETIAAATDSRGGQEDSPLIGLGRQWGAAQAKVREQLQAVASHVRSHPELGDHPRKTEIEDHIRELTRWAMPSFDGRLERHLETFRNDQSAAERRQWAADGVAAIDAYLADLAAFEPLHRLDQLIARTLSSPPAAAVLQQSLQLIRDRLTA